VYMPAAVTAARVCTQGIYTTGLTPSDDILKVQYEQDLAYEC